MERDDLRQYRINKKLPLASAFLAAKSISKRRAGACSRRFIFKSNIYIVGADSISALSFSGAYGMLPYGNAC